MQCTRRLEGLDVEIHASAVLTTVVELLVVGVVSIGLSTLARRRTVVEHQIEVTITESLSMRVWTDFAGIEYARPWSAIFWMYSIISCNNESVGSNSTMKTLASHTSLV